MKEYVCSKKEFFTIHGGYDNVFTSAFVDGRYTKTYNFSDGSQWFEVITPHHTEVAEVVLHGCTFSVDVEFTKIEYWNSEHAESRVCYEC